MLALSENPTTQEVYEYIRSYFTRPGARLARSGDRCMYRDEEGNKCAVGCLISDELYDAPLNKEIRRRLSEDYPEEREITLGEYIENKTVTPIAEVPELHDLVNGDSVEGKRKLRFLVAAQEAHDSPGTVVVAEFIKKLDVLAFEEGLTLVS